MDSKAPVVMVQQSESASHSSSNSNSKMDNSTTNEEGISMVDSMDPKTAEKVRQYQSQIKVLLHNYQVCVVFQTHFVLLSIVHWNCMFFEKLEPNFLKIRAVNLT